ncbi:hypothetical protein Tco_1506677 [Tanacetum coccineum]
MAIFSCQDKYVVEILKKFGFTEVKTASTPWNSKAFCRLKDEDVKKRMFNLYKIPVNPMVSTSSSLLKGFFSLDRSLQQEWLQNSSIEVSSSCFTLLWTSALDSESTIGLWGKSKEKCSLVMGKAVVRMELKLLWKHVRITIAQTRFESVSKHSNDLLLARVLLVLPTTVSAATTTTATIKTVDDITLAQALEEMESTKPKKKGVVIQELGESTTTISSQQSEGKDEEEVAIDAIPLAVKSPSIVGWKIYKEGRKNYYQIMRADGKSQMYMIFSQMLKVFGQDKILEDFCTRSNRPFSCAVLQNVAHCQHMESEAPETDNGHTFAGASIAPHFW